MSPVFLQHVVPVSLSLPVEGIFTTVDEYSETESVHAVASTVAKNARSTTSAESRPQLTQPIPPCPMSHNLEVGSAVELVDPPGYGIIRWIGKFPDVDIDIAGVELVSLFHR